jgi:hypothetical protein
MILTKSKEKGEAIPVTDHGGLQGLRDVEAPTFF